MIRAITFAFAMTAALAASTPARAGAPTSANGLGAFVPDNNGRSRGMGGAGIAVESGSSLLLGNPALISDYTKATWGFGVLFDRSATKPSSGEKSAVARTDPTLVRFVLPIYKGLGIGWGLAPCTRTDIKIVLPATSGGIYTDTMKSTGGINRSTFALAGAFKGIRAGAALDYYFGMIQEDWVRDFHGAAGMTNSIETVRREFRGYGMTLGALWRVKTVSLGFGYSTQSTLDENVFFHPAGEDNADLLVKKGKKGLPSTMRFGAAANLSPRLSAAADLEFSDWSSADRTAIDKGMYTDTLTFATGLRFVPSTRSISGYLARMPLSCGLRFGTLYYKSWPKIDTVNEAALTFGAELPFRNGMGSLITSYEIGKRGNVKANGWDELFMNVGISLSGAIK